MSVLASGIHTTHRHIVAFSKAPFCSNLTR